MEVVGTIQRTGNEYYLSTLFGKYHITDQLLSNDAVGLFGRAKTIGYLSSSGDYVGKVEPGTLTIV